MAPALSRHGRRRPRAVDLRTGPRGRPGAAVRGSPAQPEPRTGPAAAGGPGAPAVRRRAPAAGDPSPGRGRGVLARAAGRPAACLSPPGARAGAGKRREDRELPGLVAVPAGPRAQPGARRPARLLAAPRPVGGAPARRLQRPQPHRRGGKPRPAARRPRHPPPARRGAGGLPHAHRRTAARRPGAVAGAMDRMPPAGGQPGRPWPRGRQRRTGPEPQRRLVHHYLSGWPGSRRRPGQHPQGGQGEPARGAGQGPGLRRAEAPRQGRAAGAGRAGRDLQLPGPLRRWRRGTVLPVRTRPVQPARSAGPAGQCAGGGRPGAQRPPAPGLDLQPRTLPARRHRPPGRAVPQQSGRADRALLRRAPRRRHAFRLPAGRSRPGPAGQPAGGRAGDRGHPAAGADAAGHPPAQPAGARQRYLPDAGPVRGRQRSGLRGLQVRLAAGGAAPSGPAHGLPWPGKRRAAPGGAAPGAVAGAIHRPQPPVPRERRSRAGRRAAY
ncbi:hypothetical protein D3C81_825170 [compost metagenome]